MDKPLCIFGQGEYRSEYRCKPMNESTKDLIRLIAGIAVVLILFALIVMVGCL